MQINLVGYVPQLPWKKHTNFWPWDYLAKTFNELGLNARHINANKINHKVPQVYICWNEPDSIQLIEQYQPHKDSIIIQKLTSFDGSPESVGKEWTADPLTFFKNWHWPQYQKLDKLAEMGYRFYAFGAKSNLDLFPKKLEIVNKYKENIFWIPWGTMTVPYQEIQAAKPILTNFKYDLGFVGSKWGTKYRGNILEWETYLQPLLDKSPKALLAGKGTPKGPVSVKEHLDILKSSAICPIIHATSWKVEQGIMDRFWTVFSLGRFGVMDNVGILDFFNEKEIVLATEAGDYIEKSLYYQKNPNQQLPYIESVLGRIKKEYNQREVWRRVWKNILFE
jgi:hypothetical protein